MDTRLVVAIARRVEARINVTELCAQIGVSRQTFYDYETRFSAQGLPGLLPRSRAPAHHPNQTSEELSDTIEAWRTKLANEGLDHGARSIWAWMTRSGQDPPHPRTVHRVLVRRGLIESQPQKRPRSSFKRFSASNPNGIWQIDGMEWNLADGHKQTVVRVLDDHSRKSLGTVVADQEDARAAWAALTKAMTVHGVPAMFLSTTPWPSTGPANTAWSWSNATCANWAWPWCPHRHATLRPAARPNASTRPCSDGYRLIPPPSHVPNCNA